MIGDWNDYDFMRVERETDKAWLIRFRPDSPAAWLPKSRVEMHEPLRVRIPLWLVEQKAPNLSEPVEEHREPEGNSELGDRIGRSLARSMWPGYRIDAAGELRRYFDEVALKHHGALGVADAIVGDLDTEEP